MPDENVKPVGVIGLGVIGLGVARSFLRAGIQTFGCDLNPETRTNFEDAGGRAFATPAGLGTKTRIVFLFVVNASQVRTVLFGIDGLAKALPKDGIVISCVTMSPADAVAIGNELRAQGIAMIDAPTSGGAANAGVAACDQSDLAGQSCIHRSSGFWGRANDIPPRRWRQDRWIQVKAESGR